MSLLAAFLLASIAVPQDDHPPVTLPWVAAQLVPSPEIAIDGAPRAGMRWQVTPLLWSWGRNRKLSGVRFFMVEPTFRQSGSVELYASPEVIALPRPFLFRSGLRVYVPILARGETFSMSIATAWYVHRGAFEPGLEVGVYALSGMLGAQVTFSPMLEGARTIVTLRVRLL